MVGDILDDVEAGQRAGCRTVLIGQRTRDGEGTDRPSQAGCRSARSGGGGTQVAILTPARESALETIQ